MDLAKFKKKDLSVGIIIPSITKVNSDGSFETRALSRGRDQFGNDHSAPYFTRIVDPNRSQPDLIKPKSDYEMYELTTDPSECDLLAISYYAGTDYKKVAETIGERHFIVEDKVPVTSKTKEVDEATGFVKELPYYDNDILSYRALGYHEKPDEKMQYEGDCNTEIKLHDDCKFQMYKFIGVREML